MNFQKIAFVSIMMMFLHHEISLAQDFCAQWNRNDFIQFREDQAVTQDYNYIETVAQQCEKSLEDFSLKQCFNNIIGFSKMKNLPGTHKMQFLMDDMKYLEEISGEMQVPQELLVAQPIQEIPADFDQLIAENKIHFIQPVRLRPFAEKIKNAGWKYLAYTSQSFGNPSLEDIRSFRRLLVYIPKPAGEKDLFIQLTMPRYNEKQFLIDMISVQKPADALAERGVGARPKISFKQFWRIYPKGTSGPVKAIARQLIDEDTLEEVAIGSFEHNYSLDTCLTCHSTGLRKIYPAELNPESNIDHKYYFDEFTKPSFVNRVKEMNLKIAEYGKVDFKSSRIADLNDLGPTIGEVSQDSREFFKSCYEQQGASQKKIEVLVKASNCMACHNGSENAMGNVITQDFNRTQGGGLGLKLLVDKSMPPGKFNAETASFEARLDLTNEDRKMLFNCLTKQQDASLKSWFTKQTCN